MRVSHCNPMRNGLLFPLIYVSYLSQGWSNGGHLTSSRSHDGHMTQDQSHAGHLTWDRSHAHLSTDGPGCQQIPGAHVAASDRVVSQLLLHSPVHVLQGGARQYGRYRTPHIWMERCGVNLTFRLDRQTTVSASAFSAAEGEEYSLACPSTLWRR